jgi:ABC-2 type transport system permease protein
MRSVVALIRASLLTAASYRLAMLISVAGLIASVIPIYFISNALQPIVETSIRAEGGDYFGFLLTGIAATYVLAAATAAIPGALAGSIGSGTFEALMVTRTSLPMILTGMAGYPILWSLARALLLLGGAAVVGVRFEWSAVPAVAVIVVLVLLAYGGIGLVSAALILVFRTSGPLTTAVIAGSGLLGGVYYSTAVIPSWLQSLSAIVPLTYGLRASRMLMFGGATLDAVLPDVAMLALLAVTSIALGSSAFLFALRRARAAGTLSQY